ncbi:MAG: glutamate 5-kinase, partial [Pseudomonadales bacterium]|nr:glutamate 5-kinase [Pseudomonadales bacterium]
LSRKSSSAGASEEAECNADSAGATIKSGGMQTKLSAAQLASRSGTDTVIANGRTEDVLMRLAANEQIGTRLRADREPIAARKQWLAGQLSLAGKLQLDAGAVAVLQQSGRSLLAVGIKTVSGKFSRGEVVACTDETGREIARGLVNYDSQDVEKLRGQSSDKIEELLGFVGEEEIIHRDNLILTS